MPDLEISPENAAFALELIEDEMTTVRSQIHAASRAYHHERIAALSERLEWLKTQHAKATDASR